MCQKLLKATIDTGDCLAISAMNLARLLQISLRHLRRLDETGKIPRPIRLGGSVRWRSNEITSWLAAGAPDRRTWEQSK